MLDQHVTRSSSAVEECTQRTHRRSSDGENPSRLSGHLCAIRRQKTTARGYEAKEEKTRHRHEDEADLPPGILGVRDLPAMDSIGIEPTDKN